MSDETNKTDAADADEVQLSTEPVYFVGLDLGQTNDPAALAALERREMRHPTNRQRIIYRYALRHLERFPLGTSYPTIAKTVAERVSTGPLRGCSLAVDATGVGRPVVDMLRELAMPVVLCPITLTSGHAANRAEDGTFLVPKKDVVAALMVLFQAGRLAIAKTLPEATVLVKELKTFQTKITLAGNEVTGAWREGQHDDLVLAVALATWAGENSVRPYTGMIVYWPESKPPTSPPPQMSVTERAREEWAEMMRRMDEQEAREDAGIYW